MIHKKLKLRFGKGTQMKKDEKKQSKLMEKYENYLSACKKELETENKQIDDLLSKIQREKENCDDAEILSLLDEKSQCLKTISIENEKFYSELVRMRDSVEKTTVKKSDKEGTKENE